MTDDYPDGGDRHGSETPVVLGIEELLASILDSVEKQTERVDVLEQLLNSTPDGPWNWSLLSPEERGKLWERLYEWVCWLEDRYVRYLSPAKTGIPDLIADWYRHPIAVELLTSLMVSHAAAYRKKAAAPSFALVEWHERCLWPTLARMDALGLFARITNRDGWEGPDARTTPRDADRFARWVVDDLDALTA